MEMMRLLRMLRKAGPSGMLDSAFPDLLVPSTNGELTESHLPLRLVGQGCIINELSLSMRPWSFFWVSTVAGSQLMNVC